MKIYMIAGQIHGKELQVKIGKSADPVKRLKELQCGSPVSLRIIACVECDSRSKASTAERQCHIRLSDHRMHGEWFLLRQEQIDAVVEFAKEAVSAAAAVEKESRKRHSFSGEGIDPVLILRGMIDKAGSQLSVAAELGVSQSYLSDVLLGRKEPGESILEPLGLRRVIRYERLPTAPPA
jgi:hypothetical protein